MLEKSRRSLAPYSCGLSERASVHRGERHARHVHHVRHGYSMNLAQLLARSASTFAEHPAVSLGENVWIRYGELMRRVAAMAAGFRDLLGLEPGERVALFMGNCPQYV